MLRYALRRLALAVPVFFLVTGLCFALLHLAPGDPFAAQLTPGRRTEDVERQRRAVGLDRPVAVQYLSWVGGVLQGDLGRSLVTREPVGRMILDRLPATLELMGTALLLSLLLGVAIGTASALWRDTVWDHALRALSVAGLSIPVFWLAILAILFFSLTLGWLPPGSRATLSADFSIVDRLRHLVLPASVLALVQVPLWSRAMRAGMVQALAEDHVRTARAKGLSRFDIVVRHALRPAMVPVVMLLGMQIPTLFMGAVITETVFLWPGIGRLFFDGVLSLDITRLMGILAVTTLLILLGNLVADLVHAFLDPRVRLGDSS